MTQVFNVVFRKCLTKIFRKKINEYILSLIYLLLGIIGAWMSYKGYNTQWYLVITRLLYFMPFYGFGVLYNSKLEKYDNKISNLSYFIIVFVLQLIVITINNGTVIVIPSWCDKFTSNFIEPYIIATLAIAFWLRVSKILEPITKNSRIISYIGRNTFSIMIHQYLGFFVLNCIFALLSKVALLYPSFDWYSFKNSVSYFYLPNGLNQWSILYLIFGITIPLLINYILQKVKYNVVNSCYYKSLFLKIKKLLQ